MNESPAPADAFVDAFVDAFGTAFPNATDKADLLKQDLRQLWVTGTRTLPTLSVAPAAFGQHLAELLRRSRTAPEAIPSLPASDLFLAYCAGSGDSAGLERLFSQFRASLKKEALSIVADAALAEEVAHDVLTYLTVAQPGESARLLQYAGRCTLEYWLRVAVMHEAVKRTRGAARTPLEDSIELPEAKTGGELELIQREYQDDLRAALKESVQELSTEDRVLLGLYVNERMTMAALGRMYQLDRSSISRRLAMVRRTVLNRTRRKLAGRLRLPWSEVSSLIRILKTSLSGSWLKQQLEGEA
jgi:RNA polymerase sigma-70 factor